MDAKINEPMYFEIKIKYTKTFEDGRVKPVVEKLFTSAISFAEAEHRAYFYAGQLSLTDVELKSVRIVPYYDFIRTMPEADIFYIATLEVLILDENTGREKKSKKKVLVQAADRVKAEEQLQRVMGSTLLDWRLVGLAETDIVDYI
jgi:hypothetical protein